MGGDNLSAPCKGTIMDIIFDIDGTLADLTHRRHWVTTKPKNWPAFDKGIPFDTPHEDIIHLNHLLDEAGHRIILVSGRSDRSRAQTLMWLSKYDVRFHGLMMRKDGDYRSDDIVKEEILDELLSQGYNPKMVFDDRDRVVAMWRRRGIRTLQVAPGDF
jgi:hydroxymethylpyrimidine pyrophosphatase-like HAD family hydrolase